MPWDRPGPAPAVVRHAVHGDVELDGDLERRIAAFDLAARACVDRAVGPAERDMVQPTHRGVGRVALQGDRGGVTAPYDLGAVIEARAARCADLNLGGAGDMVVGHAPG